MYLSQAYMRNKPHGARVMLYLIAYLDAYRNQEVDIFTTIAAVNGQLECIRLGFDCPELIPYLKSEAIFSTENDELLVNMDSLKILCLNLRTRH